MCLHNHGTSLMSLLTCVYFCALHKISSLDSYFSNFTFTSHSFYELTRGGVDQLTRYIFDCFSWHDWTHSSVPVVPAERRAAAGWEIEGCCRSRCDAGGRSATELTDFCLHAPAEPQPAGIHEEAQRSAPGATRCPWTADNVAKRSSHHVKNCTFNLKVRLT